MRAIGQAEALNLGRGDLTSDREVETGTNRGRYGIGNQVASGTGSRGRSSLVNGRVWLRPRAPGLFRTKSFLAGADWVAFQPERTKIHMHRGCIGA